MSLPINGTLIALRIDTGAQGNERKAENKSVQLKDYNGKEMESKGQCRLRVTVKNKAYNVLFSVMPEGRESLIGGDTSEKLDLVRRVYQITCSEALRAHKGIV